MSVPLALISLHICVLHHPSSLLSPSPLLRPRLPAIMQHTMQRCFQHSGMPAQGKCSSGRLKTARSSTQLLQQGSLALQPTWRCQAQKSSQLQQQEHNRQQHQHSSPLQLSLTHKHSAAQQARWRSLSSRGRTPSSSCVCAAAAGGSSQPVATTLAAHLEQLCTALDVLYRFTRPHTMLGTFVSIVSVSIMAMQSFTWTAAAVSGLLQALIPALLMNVAIVGINQLYDVDIDKVNKPYLPLASGELTMQQGVLAVCARTVLAALTCMTTYCCCRNTTWTVQPSAVAVGTAPGAAKPGRAAVCTSLVRALTM